MDKSFINFQPYIKTEHARNPPTSGSPASHHLLLTHLAMPSPTTQFLAVSWPRQTTAQVPPVLMLL